MVWQSSTIPGLSASTSPSNLLVVVLLCCLFVRSFRVIVSLRSARSPVLPSPSTGSLGEATRVSFAASLWMEAKR